MGSGGYVVVTIGTEVKRRRARRPLDSKHGRLWLLDDSTFFARDLSTTRWTEARRSVDAARSAGRGGLALGRGAEENGRHPRD